MPGLVLCRPLVLDTLVLEDADRLRVYRPAGSITACGVETSARRRRPRESVSGEMTVELEVQGREAQRESRHGTHYCSVFG